MRWAETLTGRAIIRACLSWGGMGTAENPLNKNVQNFRFIEFFFFPITPILINSQLFYRRTLVTSSKKQQRPLSRTGIGQPLCHYM